MFKDLPSQHKYPDHLWGRCAPCPCLGAQASTSSPPPSACRPSPVQQRQRRTDTPPCFPTRSVMCVRTSTSTSRVFTDVFLNVSWFSLFLCRLDITIWGDVFRRPTGWWCSVSRGEGLYCTCHKYPSHFIWYIFYLWVFIFSFVYIYLLECVCH